MTTWEKMLLAMGKARLRGATYETIRQMAFQYGTLLNFATVRDLFEGSTGEIARTMLKYQTFEEALTVRHVHEIHDYPANVPEKERITLIKKYIAQGLNFAAIGQKFRGVSAESIKYHWKRYGPEKIMNVARTATVSPAGRNKEIYTKYLEGKLIKDLAKAYNISKARVRTICAKEQRRNTRIWKCLPPVVSRIEGFPEDVYGVVQVYIPAEAPYFEEKLTDGWI